MKLGEFKLEALKLMFVELGYNENYDTNELIERIAYNENYRDYMYNMPGAINRCFSILEEKRVLPTKRKELIRQETGSNGVLRFDLDLIEDFFDIDRVVYDNDNGEYVGSCDYQREGNVIILPPIGEEERYTVLYKPRLQRITSKTDNGMDVPIPDHIAAYVPYFIKGDLYRDDEPNEASEARNWFEAAIESTLESRANKVNGVQNTYSQTEM